MERDTKEKYAQEVSKLELVLGGEMETRLMQVYAELKSGCDDWGEREKLRQGIEQKINCNATLSSTLVYPLHRY